MDVRTTILGSVTHGNRIGGLKHRFANQDRTVTIDVSPEERLPIWGRIDVGRTWPWLAAGARTHRIRAASVPQVAGFSGAGSGYRGRAQNKEAVKIGLMLFINLDPRMMNSAGTFPMTSTTVRPMTKQSGPGDRAGSSRAD